MSFRWARANENQLNRGRAGLRQWQLAALFLAPSLVLYSLYVLFPIFFTFYLSFTDWDGLSASVLPLCFSANQVKIEGLSLPNDFGYLEKLGLIVENLPSCFANYQEILNDELFYTSMKNTLLWLIFYPLAAVTGLGFALFFHVKGVLVPLYKSMLFAPMVLSLVVVGTIWGWFLQPHFGLAEFLLKAVGIIEPDSEFSLMSGFNTATYGVILAACWPHAAYCMVLYLAGLSNIQKNVIEAARIDGVSKRQMVWHIILPMLSPAHYVVALVTFIGSMRAFDIIMVMTAGGPAGSTHVLSTYMYEQTFQTFRYGYGAALSMVLFAMSLGLIVIYLLQQRKAGGSLEK